MNKINDILYEIFLMKRKYKITNEEIVKNNENVSKYKVAEALKGTGNIEVLSKVYDYCKKREEEETKKAR